MTDDLLVLTTADAAELLKASEQDVMAEIKVGRLKAFPFGSGWRTTKAFILEMITEQTQTNSPMSKMNGQLSVSGESIKPTKGVPSMEQLKEMNWKQVGAFDFQWPKQLKEAEGTGLEHYDEAYQSLVKVDGKEIPFLIGFGNRAGAGMADRRRVIVFKGLEGRTLYPIVEFSGANDFATTGVMASIIRSADKKSVRPTEPVPPGYEGMPLDIYSQVVVGPRSWNCRCVKAHKTDFAVMVRHALLRMQGN